MAYGKITDKQREILEYIKQEILHKGYPPAVREICAAVNLLFRSFPSGNIGKERLHPKRSDQAESN